MYDDPISRKLINIMGCLNLESIDKSMLMLQTIEDLAEPDQQPEYIRVICECYGLCPRHDDNIEALHSFDSNFIESVQSRVKAKVDYALKGWFEINADRPIEKNMIDVCIFIQEWTDLKERAIVFDQILSSHYIPIKVNFFSRFTDEESDNLTLRKHAPTYIQLRQLLNLNVGATSRGSLALELLHPLREDPSAQAIVLGAFIDELLRRLKQKKPSNNTDSTSSTPHSPMSFPINMNEEGFKDMIDKMGSFLPPQVLDQLRKMFDQDDDEDDDTKFS